MSPGHMYTLTESNPLGTCMSLVNYKIAWLDELKDGIRAWGRVNVQSIFGDVVLRRVMAEGVYLSDISVSSRIVACIRRGA